MLQKPFAGSTVLFIPTAAMQNEIKAKEITHRLKSELLSVGILDDNITIHDINGSLTEEEAMKFDIIYVTGGSASYLARRVKEFGFDEIIKKMVFSNKVYVGMSVGSMLCMPNFNLDDVYNSEFEGLGLINAYFSVHCEKGTPNRCDLTLPHIALQENQAIEVTSDGYGLIESNLQYE